jgi:hypothetical protein
MFCLVLFIFMLTSHDHKTRAKIKEKKPIDVAREWHIRKQDPPWIAAYQFPLPKG